MIKRFIKSIIPEPLLNTYHLILAHLAAIIYGHPSKRLVVIGVTGTKGKSTTVNLIAKLLEDLGEKVGLTSTINFKVDTKEWLNNKKMTMLGRFATQKLLRDMVKAGCDYAVIETSSEGIKQSRHIGLQYDVIVFTNLSPEHIEAHGSFDNYRATKEKLFQYLTHFSNKEMQGKIVPKTIITNLDSPASERVLEFPADKKVTYSRDKQSDWQSVNCQVNASGSSFTIRNINFELNLLGNFNIYNATAAVATLATIGFELSDIATSLKKIKPLPGRQEWIDQGQDFLVMVDYAYEPTSQKQLFQLLEMVPKNRVIHVTGSTGGGRDKDRRQKLGELAASKADIVIVTNEDPYDEDPHLIVDMVANGAIHAGKKLKENLFKIIDRREAIRKALDLAGKNDLVLITGKGSEQAMCVKDGKKIPWDDRKVVREILRG